MKLNLNLSTKPLENNRRFIVGALAAGAVGALALIVLAIATFTSWRSNRDLRRDISHIEDQITSLQAQQRALGTYFDTTTAKQVLDRSNFLNSLIAERTFPWPKVFQDLERTLPTGVRIVTIQPKLSGGRAQIKLTVAAMDDESKVKFLKALEASEVFSDVHVSEEKYIEPGQSKLVNDHVVLSLEASYSTI